MRLHQILLEHTIAFYTYTRASVKKPKTLAHFLRELTVPLQYRTAINEQVYNILKIYVILIGIRYLSHLAMRHPHPCIKSRGSIPSVNETPHYEQPHLCRLTFQLPAILKAQRQSAMSGLQVNAPTARLTVL